MGKRLGADLSAVRVHTDAEADRASKAISALAFTQGSDIFFREGHYQPDSNSGRELLAHELTHVVQQTGGAVKPQLARSVTNGASDLVQRKEDWPVTAVRAAHTGGSLGVDPAKLIAQAKGGIDALRPIAGLISRVSKPEMIEAYSAHLVATTSMDKSAADVAAADEISRNQSRGFTDYQSRIWLLEGAGESDAVHELVHVLSGPGGESGLRSLNTPLNEGVTQYFTKQLSSEVTEAYPKETAFVERLVSAIGVAPIYAAYFNHQRDTLISAMVARHREKGLLPSEKGMSDAELASAMTDKLANFGSSGLSWLERNVL